MRKIVINRCFGGFGVSKAVYDFIGIDFDGYGYDDPRTEDSWDRSDPDLIRAVEELGEKANGNCAELKIVQIPEDVDWKIQEYDGSEWVAEVHRTWG